tara:strand:+ start:12476 stop:14686 length:2211 start_codon:yes stop_codon:yes gene_type:complete
MVDNVTADPGSGGVTFATDDAAGIHHPYTKMEFGGNNVQTPVTASAPLPVEIFDVAGTLVADVGNMLTALQILDNVVYSEDVPTPTTIVGSAVVMERDDVLGALTPIAGDWVGLRSSAEGALWVQEFNSDAILADTAAMVVDLASIQIATEATQAAVEGTLTVGSHAVTNAGTFVTQIDGAALTALNLIDNSIFVENVALGATPSGNLVMARQDAALTATGSIDDDATPITVDANGALWVTPSGTVVVDGSAVTQPVSGTLTVDLGANNDVTVTSGAITETNSTAILTDTAAMVVDLASIQTATEATQTALEAGIAAEGAALGSGILLQGDDGTDRTNVLVDTEGHLQVDILSGGGSNASVFVDDAAFTLASSSLTVTGAIRDDVLSTLAAIAGDAVPFRVNSTGALHVTGGGGGTEYSVDDAGPTVVSMAGVVRDDSLTTLTEIDGDATLLRVSSTGALHVTGGGGGTEYTEDVATPAPIVGTATMMERDDIIATLTPAAGDWVSLRSSAEGALWTQDFNSDQMRADLTTLAAAVSTEVQVDVVGALPAGDANIGNVDIVTLPASTNTLEVVGDVAHDAAAAGNPVGVAARATASVEGLTEVGAADATFLAADLSGALVTRSNVVPQEIVTYSVSNTAGTELAITGLDAGGAGIHNYVTSVIVHNAHATTMGFIQLLDGTGGTVLATFPAPATGGSVISFPTPLKQTTANTALYWDASAGITTLYVTIVGYQGQG